MKIAWSVTATPEGENAAHNAKYGWGPTPTAALNNLFDNLQAEVEQADSRAAEIHAAVARVRGELESLDA